jgi:hypothetical protein
MFRIYGLLFLVCLDWQGYACLSGGVGVFDGGVSEVSRGEGLGCDSVMHYVAYLERA